MPSAVVGEWVEVEIRLLVYLHKLFPDIIILYIIMIKLLNLEVVVHLKQEVKQKRFEILKNTFYFDTL